MPCVGVDAACLEEPKVRFRRKGRRWRPRGMTALHQDAAAAHGASRAASFMSSRVPIFMSAIRSASGMFGVDVRQGTIALIKAPTGPRGPSGGKLFLAYMTGVDDRLGA